MQTFSSPSLSFSNTTTNITVFRNKNNQFPDVSWNVGNKLLLKSYDKRNFASLKCETPRTLKFSDGEVSLATPEHLASVLLLWPNVSFTVNVDANTMELPLLDGSARPWFDAIVKEARHPANLCFYDAPVKFNFEFEGGYCKVEPSDTFEVEYSMERGIYKDNVCWSIYEAADLFPLFDARTFIFEEDYEAARKAGLLNGASESCGLLLKKLGGANVEVLNGLVLRHPQEPILHKVLDLVGDLTFLAPALPNVKIRIHNGGHAAHRKILERLVQYVPSRYTPEVF